MLSTWYVTRPVQYTIPQQVLGDLMAQANLKRTENDPPSFTHFTLCTCRTSFLPARCSCFQGIFQENEHLQHFNLTKMEIFFKTQTYDCKWRGGDVFEQHRLSSKGLCTLNRLCTLGSNGQVWPECMLTPSHRMKLIDIWSKYSYLNTLYTYTYDNRHI